MYRPVASAAAVAAAAVYASAGEGDLGRLDSSIKKNGAFIKKLRSLGADNRQQLLAEAAKLNLSKVRCHGKSSAIVTCNV
jgi:hypothetical protein